MKKRTKIIIARIIAVLMVFSILPFDMLTTANMVMAQELGDKVESGSTIDNETGDSDDDANIGNPESDGDNKDAGSDEETSENKDSSNGEGSDNKDSSNGESSDNTDSSDTEGSDNKDDSDTENPDGISGDSQEGEDSETTPDEEGLEDASVEESEEETVVKAASTVRASGFSNVGGWFESIYAEIAGVEATDVTEVSYTGAMTGKLSAEDLKYLVRDNVSSGNKNVRIDIPGLKAGTYTLTVKVGASTLTESGITVSAYDRSGYAHFKYTEGVGAYNDDGTLKDNAIVLYVTDGNKNTVELKVGGTTTKGIGNILNSSSGKHNSIISKLTQANTPLVVRFIGTVSNSGLYESAPFDVSAEAKIEGLTAYAATGNGGSKDDNGHMARIQYGKDITLEGIGYDATIDGWGFHYIAKTSNDGKSFEVRNLTFINTPEDAIGMEGSQVDSKDASSDLSASVERCWIHNNEFYRPKLTNAVIGSDGDNDKNEGDGSVDFKRGQYLTCSYNYFERCHKTNLVGANDTSLQFNLTYHHNHWYMCESRGPLARRANIHMYNNIFDMQTNYAQNTRADCYIFSEYNMFYVCKNPQKVEGGAIKSYHDSISGVVWSSTTTPGNIVEDKAEYVPNNCQFIARDIQYDKFDVDSTLSYIPTGDYILEEDFTKLRKIIKSQAGVQDREPKSADELSSSDCSMMPEGTTVNQITLPYDKAPGQNKVFAFSVAQNFDLEVQYSSGTGVLVNEAGENLLEGDGSVTKLPKGTYWIQSVNITAADAASGSPATFKNITISKLKITPNNSAGHDHNWVLDTQKSKDATCTEAGQKVYICSCNETKKDSIAALGHAYSDWTVTKEATATEAGSKERTCSRCGDKQTEAIPATGSGGGTSVVTPTGDHVLTFPGKEISDPDKFFTVNSAGGFADKKGPVTINGKEYSECLKFGSSTISFTCNEGATLFMAFNQSGKIKVNEEAKDIGSDGTITLKNLPAGTYEISKVSGNEALLFYISVFNPAPEVNTYTLTFKYNYNDAPEAKEIEVNKGKIYNSMSDLVPESFTRSGYTLKGLYTDAECNTEVEYPYTVTKNATLYAKWDAEPKYTIVYTPGNEAASGDFASVVAKANDEITLPACVAVEGYTFTGWSLDGSTPITGGKYTVNPKDASEDKVITITALYTATEYNITYDSNGGTLPAQGLPQKGKTGEKLTLGDCTPANPATHSFAGWSVRNSEPVKEYIVKPTDAVNGTIALKAAYIDKLVVYTIKFDANGGSLPSDLTNEELCEAGVKIDLNTYKPTRDGQRFVGWQIKGVELSDSEYTVNAADADENKVITIKAVYKPEYTINFEAGEGTLPSGMVSGNKYIEGETVTLGECTPPAGYVFKGWTVDGEAVKMPYKVTKDVTLKAEYEKVEEGPSNKGIAIIGLEKEYEFTGAKIIPNIAVVDYDIKGDDGKYGKVLSSGVDYTVKYSNNSKLTSVSKKDAIVIVTGKGNYAGKDTQATFKIIDPKPTDAALEDLKGAKLSKINPVEYSGKHQYPEIELKLKNGTSTKYIYDEEDHVYKVKEGTAKGTAIGAQVSLANNINKGTATILLTGKDVNGKATSVKKTFKITPIDLSQAGNKLTVVAEPAIYSVKGAVPKLTVHYKDDNIDKDLINGVDYTVKYSSNKNAGVKAGKIAITGKGNYAKKYTAATYDIEQLKWSTEDTGEKNPIKAVQAYAGLKAGKVKATVVDDDGNMLKPAQYTLKVYKKNGDNYTEYDKSYVLQANDVIHVEATAKEGNTDITGTTAKADFTVAEKNIAKAKFVLNKVNGKAFTAQYTGEEIELKATDLTVTLKEKGKTLTLDMGTHYEIVSYSNNINKGTATAVIKGINGYSGTKTVKFKIVGKEMKIGEENINIPWKDIQSQFKSFMDGIFN